MKSMPESNRYMTCAEVAAHYRVHHTTIRRPTPGSPFARLRRVRFGGCVRILRSDVDALDRQAERAAMTPFAAVQADKLKEGEKR
jgi:hypothetical protein